MPSNSPAFRYLLKVLAFVVFWTLVGLAFASQFYLSSSLLGRSISWSQAISYSLGDWYVWAFLSIPIAWMARRFPPEAGVSWRTAGIHLFSALAFSFAYILVRACVGQVHSWVIQEYVSFGEIFQPLLVRTFPFNLLIYGVIISVSHALDYYRKYHERTVQALELEKHLTEARLQSLLRQLKPHFLFNALNGVASLMYSDVAAAERMLIRLADLLRLTMTQSGEALTPLRDEVAFLGHYLEIEQIRFRDRISVEFKFDDNTLDAKIPSMLLQPLAENSIRHGIEPRSRKGSLVLGAAREGGDLILSVVDDGRGLPEGGPRREGIGISNTRARHAELYADPHRFEIVNQPSGGVRVTIRIPFST
jgi:sensor histidine kinase YesM